MKLKESIAIISGGASGLGEACARALVAAGAKVCILDLAVDRGEKIVAELGGNAIFAKTDVTNEESVKIAIQKTLNTFGGLNVAINCAGIVGPAKVYTKKGPMPLEVFNRVIQINLVGSFNVVRLAIEQMVKNATKEDGEKGVIINTSSGAAYDGQIGQPAYSASKAGIVGMTLPLARECADYGIRVMAIAPGLFATPMATSLSQEVQESLAKMIPFPRRLGNPHEFASLAIHIVENQMLNGEVIRLDGAMRLAAR
jgi:3-hydroxyacyl-CoA dehydrogenase/3-hydroxy-2-methylbutyryl-CoA dehydrogenase